MGASKPSLMIRVAVTAFALSVLSTASATTANKNYVANPGFERADPTEQALPKDWEIDVAHKIDDRPVAWRDRTARRCGAAAARIHFVEAMNYAGVLQRVSTSGLAGKDVQFSGFVRRSSGESIVGIWMLAADGKDQKLSYINSYGQPAKVGRGWSWHVVTMRIPPEATTIKLGAAIYEQDGTMWADDLRLSETATRPVATRLCNTGHMQ
jgi:hypothetical protein